MPITSFLEFSGSGDVVLAPVEQASCDAESIRNVQIHSLAEFLVALLLQISHMVNY
jgi:hypothetical protein